MTRINLLPWRETRRKQQQRDFIGMVTAAVIVAAFGVLLTHMQFASLIERQETRNQYLRTEIAKLQKAAEEIKELDKAKARLLSRLEIIQDLQSSRPGMVKVFDALARRLPDDIYLGSFKSEGDQLTLAGTARSNNVLSGFMRNITNSDQFGEPVLKVIENKDTDGVRVSAFELTVNRTTPKGTQEAGSNHESVRTQQP